MYTHLKEITVMFVYITHSKTTTLPRIQIHVDLDNFIKLMLPETNRDLDDVVYQLEICITEDRHVDVSKSV